MAGDRADLVLTGGVVHTVDPDNNIAEAVAVSDGRILAVSSNADVTATAGMSRIADMDAWPKPSTRSLTDTVSPPRMSSVRFMTETADFLEALILPKRFLLLPNCNGFQISGS